MKFRRDRIRRRRTTAAAAGHEKQIRLFSIRAHHRRQKSVRVGTILQNRRARAVAKKHTGITVLPVHNRGKFFCANDQHRVVSARHDELLRDFESVNEPGTRGFEIERRRAPGADFVLHETRRCRERHIRRDGGDNDEINLFAGDAGHFHRALCRVRGHVRSEFVLRRHAPFLDAGARGDPFIRRLHHFFQVGVGQNFLRHIRTDAGNGTRTALEIVFGARVFKFGAHTGTAQLEPSPPFNFLFARAISRAMI